MNEIVLKEADKAGFARAFEKCKEWCAVHQAEIGVGEMALGAAILSWGVMSGHVVMGQDVVASKLADVAPLAGSGIGAIAGAAVAAKFLSGLFIGGVAGVSGVVAVPAVVIIGGGALIFGAFGHSLGDEVASFISPPSGFGDYLAGASIVAVGIALMIDGASRIIKDERVLAAASRFRDGVIQLIPQATEIVATTKEELQSLVKELGDSSSGIASASATAGVGAAIGGSIAAGSVTVLGSHGLGAVALSLGLVSAPVWPVIAGGATGLAIGVAAWKGIKHYRDKRGKEEYTVPQLPNPEKQ